MSPGTAAGRAARAVVVVAMAAAVSMALPARAQVPLVFGTSFGTAPVVGPGVYTDVIQRLEQLYVAVEVQDGQRLKATATVAGDPSGPKINNGTAVNLDILGTNRFGHAYGLEFWDGRTDVVVDVSSAVIGDPAQPTPGRQFLRLGFGGGSVNDELLDGRDYVFRLAVEVVQDRPPTTTITTAAASTTARGEPLPTPARAAPGRTASGEDSPPVWAGGVAVFVLGGAGGAAAVVARRRRAAHAGEGGGGGGGSGGGGGRAAPPRGGPGAAGRLTPGRAPMPRRDQRGQSALEYLAMLVAAAAIVAVVLATQPGLRRWVDRNGEAVAGALAPPPAPAPASSGGGGGGGVGGVLLDLAGAVPFAGDAIDAVRCASNLARGEFGEAAFQCAAVIPFVGNAALALRAGRRVDDVLDAARAACRANSFLPATAVLGADGVARPIEAIAVGDAVLATDAATGTTSARRVTDVIVGRGLKDLVRVSTGATSLTATAGHPFYVLGGRGWVEAADLAPGDALRTPGGTPLVVTAAVAYTATTTVHNLSVQGVHTYYAGDQPVLVHNCHRAGTALSTAQIAANRQAREAALRGFQGQYYRFGRETFMLDKQKMNYILARHHPRYWDGSTKATQSFFEESATVEDIAGLVDQTLRQNRDVLANSGLRVQGPLFATIDGVRYKLALSRGRVVSFFPLVEP